MPIHWRQARAEHPRNAVLRVRTHDARAQHRLRVRAQIMRTENVLLYGLFDVCVFGVLVLRRYIMRK